MRAPRLESCYFGDQLGRPWHRLAGVLRYTAERHCPGWSIRVEEIAPVALDHRLGARTLVRNSQKLERWRSVVAAAAEGDRVLLIDTDTMIVNPLDDVWDLEFDVAYTTKPAEYPINGGVMFLRVSPAVRAFMDRWAAENLRMLKDPGFHQPWRRRFAGINQASLGYLLEEARPAAVAFRELPCATWNCEDASWDVFDPTVTRIVHVKSALRLACIDTQPIPPMLAELAARWKAADRDATRILQPA